jgi:hypothetical protein
MELKNLTPHPIDIILVDGTTITLPPDTWTARRVPTRDDPIAMLGDIPVWGDLDFTIKGLPNPEPGVIYITSASVATFVRRPDVMSVYSGPRNWGPHVNLWKQKHGNKVRNGTRGLMYYGPDDNGVMKCLGMIFPSL